jgi:hypothetical protein
MKTAENPSAPFDAVVAKLSESDDRDFWQAALTVLADEFLRRYAEEAKNREWVLIVGACSHWVRPHNSSWKTTSGRFMNPDGYKDSSPELDWSVTLVYQGQRWMPVEKLSGKRQRIFRVAIPTRTTRHKQAAVNTRWSPGGETVLYGFRRVDGRWACVAVSDGESPRRSPKASYR